MSHEMRQNKLTGQWVIFATERALRPGDYDDTGPPVAASVEHYESRCPFCAGNEDMLPEIIMETMHNQAWQVRVVPNKYPMLMDQLDNLREERGLFLAMPGNGKHEVIIDHPLHNMDFPDMEAIEVRRVFETYRWRYIQLMATHDAMSVVIFRNHGREAGASLVHPHSQLVVTGIVPPEIRWQEQRSQEYFDTWGRNLMGDILKQELEDGLRIVRENESFVAFVPYAADVPFEIWIVPRRQQADFADISSDELSDLSAIVQFVLTRLRDMLNDPAYNFVIRSAARFRADEPHLHWYLEIRPRLTTRAGFELATGMLVNPSLPEMDAALLRGEPFNPDDSD